MKKIIGGITYNTDTAVIVGQPEKTPTSWCIVYQTRHGAFFTVTGNLHHGKRDVHITPITKAQAAQACRDASLLEPTTEERRITLRLPPGLARQLETIAKTQGVSVNSYVMTKLNDLLREQHSCVYS